MGTKLHPLLLEKQEDTVIDVNEKLDIYGKCLMIRPTGFGKTYLLIEKFTKPFIRANKSKTVVYIYPLDIIKTEIVAGKKRVDEDGNTVVTPSKYLKDKLLKFKGKNANMMFISYQELSRKFNEDNEYWVNFFIEHNVGLIILDEAHRAGSEKFYEIYDSIKELISPDKIRILGATATPDRMDDCDEKMPVLDYVFDGKQPFKYGLGEAIKDGLIPEMVYMADRFTITEQSNNIKKQAKSKFGDDFDEKSFNVELGKLRQETGDEPNVIMNSIIQAGYNPVKDKYYKFIVFFTNIEDMIDQAEMVEEWFEEAFNSRLSTRFQLKKKFNLRTSYITSSDPDNRLRKLANKEGKDRHYFNKTKSVEEIIEEDLNVDLLFTVDMINMGYHVENITGIMMRRGTKSEIVYYQQLGRALSVSASHSPIIIDCVNNIGENFWAKKDAKHRENNGEGTGIPREEKEIDINPKYIGSLNAFNRFMERYDCSDNMVERLDLEFMYNDRHMPLYILATYYGITCKELIKKLIKYNIKINKEDAEYQRIMDNCRDYHRAKDIEKLKDEAYKLKFINCKEATYNGKCEYIKNKQVLTMYDMLNNRSKEDKQ
ncbi:MAG: DEAD/DEAH box helicase family protein [Lachnospiraceae bacterium]|nr:DEAD/DEAH box helicase family protein [Lachnospiraceae bacterium]